MNKKETTPSDQELTDLEENLKSAGAYISPHDPSQTEHVLRATLSTRISRNIFLQFLDTEFSSENLLFWEMVEKLRLITNVNIFRRKK